MTKQIAILNTGYESYEYEYELFARNGFELSIYSGPKGDSALKYEFAKDAVGILVRDLVNRRW